MIENKEQVRRSNLN